MSSQEFIVREISMVVSNITTMIPGDAEDFDNAGRFFNDTTITLDLVAFRLGSIINNFPSVADIAANLVVYGVVELSRQAVVFQQEGILGSVRGSAVTFTSLIASGNKGNHNITVGEKVYGDFKTRLMTLEQQTNIFLNGRMINSTQSGDSFVATQGELQGGATCYFRRRGRR